MKRFGKYLFEITIIFIGITASFLVEEWRQDLENRERLLSNLELVKSELVADTVNLYNIKSYLKTSSDTIFSVLERKQWKVSTFYEFVEKINILIGNDYQLEIHDTSFRSLVNNDLLRHIKNDSLTQKLQNYYELQSPNIFDNYASFDRLCELNTEMIYQNTDLYQNILATRKAKNINAKLPVMSKQMDLLLENREFYNRIGHMADYMLYFTNIYVPPFVANSRELIKLIDKERLSN